MFKTAPMKNLMLLTLLSAIFSLTNAQLYTIPTSGGDTIQTCTGTITGQFMQDSVYPNGNIAILPANENATIVLSLDTLYFGSCCNYLVISNGPSPADPNIISIQNNYNLVDSIFSTDETGALNIRFRSQSYQYGDTFSMNVGCLSKDDLPGSDVEITSFSFSKEEFRAGQSFYSIPYTVRNNTVLFQEFSVNIYLSKDSVFDENAIQINEYDNELFLKPFEEYQRFERVTIPSYIEPGDYYVMIVADDENDLDETNETNNTKHVSVSVLEPDIELKIEYLGDANVLTPGVYTKIPIQISNEGESIADSVIIDMYLSENTLLDASDSLIHSYTLNRFYNSQSYESNPIIVIDTASNWPAGAYFLITTIDSDNKYAEENEEDNLIIKSVILDKKTVDFQLQKMEQPHPGTIGKTSVVNIWHKITRAPYRNTLGFYLSEDSIFDAASDSMLTQFPVNNFSGSEKNLRGQFQIDIPDNMAEGTYTLFVQTLDDNLYNELTPENNLITSTFEITSATCDIWVNSIGFNQKKVEQGKDYLIFPEFGSYGLQTTDTILTTCVLSQDTLIDDTDIEFVSYEGPIGSRDYFMQPISIPADIEPGEYYIIEKIKLKKESEEYSYINNTIYRSITIVDKDSILKTDYKFDAFDCPDTISDNFIEVNYSVINEGASWQNPIKTGFILSKDTVLDPGDQILFIGDELYLDFGQSLTRVENVYFPDGISPGDYTLFAKTDVANQVNELFESNNIEKQAIHLSQAIKRDWNCRGTSIKPIITPGEFINQEYQISDFYLSDTQKKGKINYYLTTEPELTFEAEPIYSDTLYDYFNGYYARTRCYIPDTTTHGKYYLWAQFHPPANIPDADTTNNTYMHDVWIINRESDLAIDSLKTDKTYSMTNQCNISLSFSNKSDRPFNNMEIDIYISADRELNKTTDNLVTTLTLDNSSPGEIKKLQKTISLGGIHQDGEYYIFAHIDPEKFAGDTNLLNNTDTTSIYFITPDIDYKIHSVESSDTLSFYNNHVSSLIASNVGTETSNTPITVEFYLSEDSILDSRDKLISSRDRYIYSYQQVIYLNNYFDTTFCEGGKWYYLIFKVDSKDIVRELSELNNTLYKKVFIQKPERDLSINISDVVSSATPGKRINLKMNITNTGTIDTRTHEQIAFLSTDSILDITEDVWLETNYYNYHLGTNASQEINYSPVIPATMPYGDYYLFTMVDAFNKLPETNEANNIFMNTITLENPFLDLALPSRLPHKTMTTGGSTSGYISITNKGNYTVEDPILNIWLSQDTIVNDQDTLLTTENPYYFIETGETKSEHYYFTLPGGYDSGEYYILFNIGNRNDTILDAVPTNNTCVQPLTLNYSNTDLSLDSCALSSHYLNSGSHLMVNSVIRNVGTEDLNSSVIGYLLSEDTIADASDYLLSTDYVDDISVGYPSYVSSYFHIPYGYYGNYYLLAVADYNNVIQESNENNNMLFREIYIESDNNFYDTVDYSFTEASLRFTSYPDADDSVHVQYTIERDRIFTDIIAVEYWLTNSYDFDMYRDGFLLHLDTLHLESNEEPVLVNNTFRLPNNYEQFTSITLVINSSIDYNISNNIYSIDYNSRYDLLSSDALLYNSMATPGGIVSTVFKALNNGIETINNPEYGFYLSPDENWSSDDIFLGNYVLQKINGNDTIDCSKSMLIPEVIETGDYYFLIVSDYAKKVSEDNESNNIEALPLQITNNVEHDLSITVNIDESDILNDTMYFNGYLANTGDLHCNNIAVTIYFSFDEYIDNLDIKLDTLYFQQLGLNDTIRFSDMVVLPKGISEGSYYLIFKTISKTESYDSNSENDSSPVQFKIGEQTSIYEPVLSEVKIYPNPVDDKLIIIQDNGSSMLYIYDIHGKLMMAQNVAEKKHELDLSVLPAGTYIIKMLWNEKVSIQKIIKK